MSSVGRKAVFMPSNFFENGRNALYLIRGNMKMIEKGEQLTFFKKWNNSQNTKNSKNCLMTGITIIIDWCSAYQNVNF